MKKLLLTLALLLTLTACGNQDLIPMTSAQRDGRHVILWEDRVYRPFCVVSKADCGEPIGIVDGRREEIVSSYKDLSPQEWLATYLTMDGGAMRYREEKATGVPAGLTQEYD